MNHIDIEGMAHELGPNGPGFAVSHRALPEGIVYEATDELLASDTPWYPQYNRCPNQRNLEVTQAFDVFAHKYGRGSQESVLRMPAFHSIGVFVTSQLVRPLAEYFPALLDWQVDELSAQRYPLGKGLLTWHRDLARHPGVIAICNTAGQAKLGVRHAAGESMHDLAPGDIAVLRAPGLFDATLIEGDLRPEHAVMSVEGDKDRISVTVRANTKPAKPINNFRYHNWS